MHKKFHDNSSVELLFFILLLSLIYDVTLGTSETPGG